MKFITALLAITLTAQAAPSDPGKVAIDFLEKVRQRKLDLEPGGDTALSAHTAEEKKQQIARRLERIAHDLGTDPLELGEVKMDENFAAVLVRKIGSYDASRLQVFPVALVKRGAEWMAAPVPASFENAGTGYAVALRKRLELLENWMLQQQVVDLEKLRETTAANMRRKIEVNLTAKELRSFSARQVSERFLAACDKGDLPSLLGLIGGLADELPDDWAARLKAAERAISAGASAPRPWRLLTAPDVLRVIAQDGSDNDDHLITIDCLDPAGHASKPPRIELVQFELARQNDGLWQVNLPQAFLEKADDPQEESDSETDSDLLDAFPEKWSEQHPSTPHPTAELAHEALVATLQNGNLPSLLAISLVEPNPEVSRKTCIQVAQTWWALRDPADIRMAMPLAFTAHENTAAGIFQFFSVRDSDKFDARVMYFKKYDSGWLWTANPADDTQQDLKSWVDSETKRWANQWPRSLLTGSVILAKLDDLKAPTESDARQCVMSWLDATRRGDFKSALNQTAHLGTPHSSAAVLQNLGYEIHDASHTSDVPVITGFYQGKIWTAVGVKTQQAGKSSYRLYPVIQTPQGARIMIEIDLFACGNRGRDFLNRTAFERLQDATSASMADELRNLYASHQANIQSTSAKSSP